jgi:O-antigen ligase
MLELQRTRQPIFYTLTAFWSLLLLANFVPVFPQPGNILGYLWKIEFALGLFLFLWLIFLNRNIFDLKNFSKQEVFWIILPLLSFTVWSGFSIFWAESWRFALHHTLLWACYLIFYLLIRQATARPKALNFSLLMTGTTVLMLSVICLSEYFSTAPENSGNISLRYGKYAEAIVSLLPVFIALAAGKKSRRPYLFLFFALVAWIGIIASLGRTQFLTGIAAAAAFFALAALFSYRRLLFKRTVLFVVLFASITVLSQVSFSGNTQQTTLKRFSGSVNNQLSFKVRILFWRISLESVKRHPFLGIGADNFSPDYRNTREQYAVTHRKDPQLIHYEVLLPERSHNEFLQILTELGLAGFLLFAWLLLGIVKLLFAGRKRKVSLAGIASFVGMAAFLLSSAVSSYSFRVPANGVCFFFLLALFVKEFGRTKETEPEKEHFTASFAHLKPYFAAAAFAICGAMLVFSGVRGTGLYFIEKASTTEDLAEAERFFQTALAIDDRDSSFHFAFAQRLFAEGAIEKSIPHFRQAIDRGAAVSVSYYYLASAQGFVGKPAEAEETFLEGLRLYPRSVFLRTAYAAFLQTSGQPEKADIEYAKAFRINEHQTRSWMTAHTAGVEKLSLLQVKDSRYTEVMELKPTVGIYALLDFQRHSNPKLFRNLF